MIKCKCNHYQMKGRYSGLSLNQGILIDQHESSNMSNSVEKHLDSNHFKWYQAFEYKNRTIVCVAKHSLSLRYYIFPISLKFFINNTKKKIMDLTYYITKDRPVYILHNVSFTRDPVPDSRDEQAVYVFSYLDCHCKYCYGIGMIDWVSRCIKTKKEHGFYDDHYENENYKRNVVDGIYYNSVILHNPYESICPKCNGSSINPNIVFDIFNDIAKNVFLF